MNTAETPLESTNIPDLKAHGTQITVVLLLIWLIVLIALAYQAWSYHENQIKRMTEAYNEVVTHRDSLMVGWLNCAEGWPMRVYYKWNLYVEIDCRPKWPKGK